MKEVSNNNRGIAFGFASVVAGQRQTTQEPQLVVVSTEGAFRITGTVSKLLGVSNGDYISFISNVGSIDKAIAARDPQIISFCEDNGLNVESPEAIIAIHREFDMWGIYKGIKEYDSKGNPKTCAERLSKKDRVAFVTANYDEMFNAAIESGNEELIAALNAEGVTEEQRINLLCPFVQSRELPKYSGSRLASASDINGVGVNLNFSDTNVWMQLKADLGEEANKINRVYTVDTKQSITVPVDNGYETVNVNALLLTSYVDEKPISRNAKVKKEDETESAE